MFDISFIITAVLLGLGLAADAFSVSLANGMCISSLSKSKENLIALTFAGFQFIMPLIGWFLVHSFVIYFSRMSVYIPWIALILLGYIGIKMIKERNQISCDIAGGKDNLETRTLILQGIATSIDALSVGFTISELNILSALAEAGIIGAVTYALCLLGVKAGKKAGVLLAGKASVLGGTILILIGIKIFISNLL